MTAKYDLIKRVDLPPEVIEHLANPIWRLHNLYEIVDRDAQIVPFRPNAAQDDLLSRLHTRNLILKARQRGFSTLLQLAALDQALWNENFTAGIIANNLDNASKFLARIMFSYRRLPPEIRAAIGMEVEQSNSAMIHFANGSYIHVDTSYRSGTLQFLHISEFGNICANYPDKAREIVTGSIPALAPTGMLFIESTAEGNAGYFYDMAQRAEAAMLQGKKLSPLDLKFFFYSWYDEPSYQLDPGSVILTQQDREYFDRMERELGIVIDAPHRAWYVAQRETLGEDMLREHPTTPAEAFAVSVQGQYYAQQLAAARREGRIGVYPHLPDRPVYTLWDIGSNDNTAVWCFQYAGARLRFIQYLEDSGQPYAYFVNQLVAKGYVMGTNYLPHDAAHKRQHGLALKSALDMLQELQPGWRFEIVAPIADVTVGIQQTRMMFPVCEFDEAGCGLGLKRLTDYRKEWNTRLGVWKDTPLHDIASDGADAFRQGGQLYAAGLLNAPKPMVERARTQRGRNWRVA